MGRQCERKKPNGRPKRELKVTISERMDRKGFMKVWNKDFKTREKLKKEIEFYLNETPPESTTVEGLAIYLGLTKKVFINIAENKAEKEADLTIAGYFTQALNHIADDILTENKDAPAVKIFRLKNDHDYKDDKHLFVDETTNVKHKIDSEGMKILQELAKNNLVKINN